MFVQLCCTFNFQIGCNVIPLGWLPPKLYAFMDYSAQAKAMKAQCVVWVEAYKLGHMQKPFFAFCVRQQKL